MSQGSKFLLAGVMGWPVMHSRSPKLHNYWLQHYGLAGSYVPLEIKQDQLEQALRALPVLNFAGCNLTIPHKETALRLVDSVDPVARRIGAVNTIVVGPNGQLEGRNTDAYGFISSVSSAQPEWHAGDRPIVVLGAGGGCRAVLTALIEAGAQEIWLANRNRARADALAQEFGPPIAVCDWSKRHEALDEAGLLVNTTSLGMLGQPPLDIVLRTLPVTAIVCDIVYVPLETPLLAAARRRGNPTVDGLGMLLHQARPAFEAWFGVLPDVTPALRTMMEATL
ncbi:MAG: shikimate dehydrogenase [Methylobacteriaceae bacterium]|nr:shikimate dehydrogenase [Methylobacteriaceae bacterium]